MYDKISNNSFIKSYNTYIFIVTIYVSKQPATLAETCLFLMNFVVIDTSFTEYQSFNTEP